MIYDAIRVQVLPIRRVRVPNLVVVFDGGYVQFCEERRVFFVGLFPAYAPVNSLFLEVD